MSEKLACYDCNSETLEWVGHRPIVRCRACGMVWQPRESVSTKEVAESISQDREELPEKGSAFAPYTLMRLNGEAVIAGERVRLHARA